MHDSDGHNVNAIYGFFRMLFRLWEQKPDHFVIARDAPSRTFRKEINEDYKANRITMPDNFKWQMTMIKELVNQLQIQAEEIPGFEADDIIYTLVQHAKLHEHSTVFKIVSSDKDLKQMLTDNVVMYDAMKNLVTDPQSFYTEFGFAPVQIVDYLALV
ncbi:MAG: hypothetical protein H6765_02940 [Candidatus Peribacteria bacterium]|nr:MAG: hypothetical protein H6765_02940 [Candidatus Peribacteria bacterium]